MARNAEVRTYWEAEPCGTGAEVVGDLEPGSDAWFDATERHRYAMEPFIHSFAQFSRWRGRRVLEVGVGAGVDHLQFARAGAQLSGVDLTAAAIDVTRSRLAREGLASRLQRVDAEELPFPDGSFDLVYSWGVIHHAQHPERIVAEIRRVLDDGGRFVGMLYGRRSPLVVRLWIRHALLAGAPLRSPADVVAEHMESPGTKAYTVRELRTMFDAFRSVDVTPILTPYDLHKVPKALHPLIPKSRGWFLAVTAQV